MAHNDLSKRASRKPAGKQAISQHPLFPVIVALWLAALCGLASIAVRPTLIEQVVLTLGIDKIIPMAAPPLGTTFRILLALALAVMGGVIGLLVAHRIVRPAGTVQIRKRSTAPDKENSAPLSARSMPIGDTMQAMFANRDRGQVSAESATVQVATLAEPALPNSDTPQILKVTEFDLEGFEQPAAEAPQLDEIGQTANVVEDARLEAPTETASTLEEPLDEDIPADYQPLNNRLFETYSREIAVRSAPAADQSAFAPSPVYAHMPEPGFDLLMPADTQPGEEPGFAVAQELPASEQLAEAENGFAEAWVDQEPVASSQESGISSEPPHTAAERIAGADLEALSPVELLERLGLALERKRVEVAARAQAAIPVAPAETVAEAWTAPAPEFVVPEYTPPEYSAPEYHEPTAEFSTQDFSQPVQTGFEQSSSDQPDWSQPAPDDLVAEQPAAWDVPAALRPVAFDEIPDESDVLPGYVPPRHIGLSAAMPGEDQSEEDEEDSEEESRVLKNGYSSLLGLSRGSATRQQFIADTSSPAIGVNEAARPFAQSFDDNEGRVQQSIAKPDPEDTERALRAALATLQRMSGAA